MEKWCCLPSVF